MANDRYAHGKEIGELKQGFVDIRESFTESKDHIYRKIDSLKNNDIHKLDVRLSSVERKIWMATGAVGALASLAQLLIKVFMK